MTFGFLYICTVFLDLVYFTTRVPDASATRVENFDFHNNTNENIFSHPYISYIANERLT